jgi:hypothetical protein
LWINHRFGYYDPETGTNNLWLAICYNEDCLRTHERRLALYNMLFDDCYNPKADILRPGKAPSLVPDHIESPGHCYPLDYIAANFPDDPPCEYLRSRGFDPAWLGQTFKISVCSEPNPKFWQLAGRIIIPIYMDGKLRGWQARYVGEPPDKQTPKYFSMPGMKKTQLLYNYDIARKFPFGVLVEGPTDVWRVGPEAVALFGKHISVMQKQLIAETWGNRAVVVLLDGDAVDEARRIYAELEGLVRHRVLVELPDGTDPGSLAHEELEQLILMAALQQGVDLCGLTPV